MLKWLVSAVIVFAKVITCYAKVCRILQVYIEFVSVFIYICKLV